MPQTDLPLNVNDKIYIVKNSQLLDKMQQDSAFE